MSTQRLAYRFDRCPPPAPELALRIVAAAEGRVVIEVGGELDPATEHQLTTYVDQLVQRCAPHLVIVDLSLLTFCSAAGIRALLQARTAVAAHGGELVLRDPGPGVLMVLAITGDLGRFTIQATEPVPA